MENDTSTVHLGFDRHSTNCDVTAFQLIVVVRLSRFSFQSRLGVRIILLHLAKATTVGDRPQRRSTIPPLLALSWTMIAEKEKSMPRRNVDGQS